MILEWIVWAALTLAWNSVNSVNSRAKNSRSASYNFFSTVVSSALYMTALLFVGNMLLKARSLHAVELAVLIYAGCSATGSVLGQRFALRFFGQLERKR